MTSIYRQPIVLPISWRINQKLNDSFADGLKIFYQRVPFTELGQPIHLNGEDIDTLLAEAAELTQFPWAVVFGVGTIFGSQLRIVKEIEKFIDTLPDDILVCGRLIDKKGFYCGIHEQFFLVNLKKYRELGRPPFGDYETSVRTLRNYTAGESIHDDYTPKFILPAPGQAERKTKVCGWNFIHTSVSNGLKVLNIPDELRRIMVFLYPDDETEKLNKNIEFLHKWEDLENVSQRIALAHLMIKKLGLTHASRGTLGYAERPNCIFFFNTEFLLPEREEVRRNGRGPIDLYCGPCSGFQDIAFLKTYGFHDETEIIYYDVNRKAMDVKQFILENFDGNLENLEGLLARVRKAYPDDEIYSGFVDVKIQEMLEIFNGNREDFRQTWQRMCRLKKRIVRVNLLSQSERLLKEFSPSKRIFFNITDIFLGQNELLYGYQGMLDRFTQLHQKVSVYPELMLTGLSLSQRRFLGYAKDLKPLEL